MEMILNFLLLGITLAGAIACPFAIMALRKYNHDNGVLISLLAVIGVLCVFWFIAIVYGLAVYGVAL
jgi:hypothetical protein